MHVDTSGYRVKISSYFTHHIYEVAMITVVGGNKGKADQNDDALYGEGGEEDEDEPEPLENLDEEDE